MFLQICAPLGLLVVASLISLIDAATIDGDNMPFDFFLRKQQEELSRDIPLSFNPDDGLKYRKSYEDKWGERGERLIAWLGSGIAPISIYDAALLGKPTSKPPTTSTEGSTPPTDTSNNGNNGEERDERGHDEEDNKNSDVHHENRSEHPEENHVEPHFPTFGEKTSDRSRWSSWTTEAPTTAFNIHVEETTENKAVTERKYVEIDRKHNGFLTESFLQNNIPQESYQVSPDGIIYKRLYGAIWNHGEKGLEQRYPSLFPSFNSNPFTNQWGLLQFDQLPQAGSQQLQLDSSNLPSESKFAGPGEPSILVQSYSYRK